MSYGPLRWPPATQDAICHVLAEGVPKDPTLKCFERIRIPP